MKKSIKILSLVLALAIICGALVVGVFAKTADAYKGVAGVQVIKTSDVNSSELVTIKGTDGASGNSTIAGLGATILGRYGIFSVEKSPYENNKYIKVANGAKSGTSAPYFGSGYKQIGQMIDVNNGNKYTYQIIDMDLTFPDDVSPSFTVRMEQRGYKSAGSTGTVGSSAGPSFQVWSNDSATDKKVYIKESLVGGKEFVLSASEWTHVTFIVECVKTGKLADGTDANGSMDEMVDMYAYLALNGEIVDKVSYGTQKSRWGEYNFCFSEIRCNLNSHYASGELVNSSLAMDNFSWWSIDPTAYDATKLAELKTALAGGEGADLTKWSDCLYDAASMNFGKLVATIGEGENIKNFDNLAEAVAAAEAGQTIELKANTTDLVAVDKAITVKKNGFTANFINEGLKLTETEEAYVFESSNVKMTVRVQACKCGKGCIEAKTITVFDGANIWDAICVEYGKEPKCSYEVDGVLFDFDGFTVGGTAANLVVDANGKFDTTKVVDSSLANKVATLTVSYVEKNPIAKILNADGSLNKYEYSGTNLQTMVGHAETAGGTLVLLADFSTDGTGAYHKYINKSMTLDLNGYTLKHLTASNEDSKTNSNSQSVFYSNSASVNVTITSSVEGGKIFGAACYKKQNRPGAPFAAGNADGSTVTIIGQVDGKTTLSFYGATIYQSYSKQGKINVDGGYYIRNRGDNQALIEMRVQGDSTFKNMTVNGGGSAIFSFNGQKTGMADTTAKVTIDNCNLYNSSNVIYRLGDPVTVTFTNTVIGSKLVPEVDGAADAPAGNNIVIGKGCKLADGVVVASYAAYDGEVQNVSETISYKEMVNDWTVGADNFALTEKTVDVVIAKALVDVFEVEFTKNGETVTTAKVYAGQVANVNTGVVEGTKGMVETVVAVQVPADAKAGDKIEIPADAKTSYVAGKVPVQFSISITGHTTYNFFLPLVDGITYDKDAALVHSLPGYSPARPAVATTATDAEGNKWMKINTWPGMYLLDEVGAITIKYSYEGTQLSYTIKSFGAIDYCEYIINNDKNSDELKAVVANALYTANKFDLVKGSRVTDKMTEVLASEAFKAAFKLIEAPADATNKDVYAQMAADGYVKEISLISGFSSTTGTTVGIKMNEGYGFKMNTKKTSKYNASLVGEWRLDGTGYFYMHNIRSYAFNEVFVIDVYESYTAKVENGVEKNVTSFDGKVVATYEWSLAGYINDNAETLTADQLAYAKALYSYAEAACDYLQWKKDNGLNMNT